MKYTSKMFWSTVAGQRKGQPKPMPTNGWCCCTDCVMARRLAELTVVERTNVK